jgi:hypothetical protein
MKYPPDDLPPGLGRTVLKILGFHVGKDRAISRGALVDNVSRMGLHMHERAVRACINEMRKNGTLICSTGGEEGGYWIPKDWNELEDYIERELHSRAMDLLEQEKALRKEGEKRWGPASKQEKLF